MGFFTDNDLNINKQTRFTDLPFYKRINVNGEVETYTNEQALSNAFTIWLTSALNENLRVGGGGVLYKHLGKAMNDDRAKKIRDDILSAAEKEFTPTLTFRTLQIIGDLTNKKWQIYIEAFNAEFNIGFSSAIAVNNNS